MKYNSTFKIGDRLIGNDFPTYFIADIGANHDGNLQRARDLIRWAKDAGADCAKFQHFQASKIVSAKGFDGIKSAHQRGWDRSVFEVYEDYSINPDWNEDLAATAKKHDIDFMSTPYDKESAASIRHLVRAYKIGSGDITYYELLCYIASMKAPVFLATGASTMDEVKDAVATCLKFNKQLCLMQCNTNYTGSLDNFRHVNLRVLESYRDLWPDLPLGLSDHTPGNVCVLGAVALGVRVVEKHFTDDVTRKGPDHSFALNPEEWDRMVKATRILESAMGDGIKRVEANEEESRIVQRRAIRLKDSHVEGAMISADMVEYLRPCPDGAYTPSEIGSVMGRRLRDSKEAGEEIYPEDLDKEPC